VKDNVRGGVLKRPSVYEGEKPEHLLLRVAVEWMGSIKNRLDSIGGHNNKKHQAIPKGSLHHEEIQNGIRGPENLEERS